MEQIVTILYLVLSPETTPTHTATTTETRNTTVTPPACNQCLGIEEESLILLVCLCCTTRVWTGKNVPYSLVSKQRHGRSTSSQLSALLDISMTPNTLVKFEATTYTDPTNFLSNPCGGQTNRIFFVRYQEEKGTITLVRPQCRVPRADVMSGLVFLY